MFREYKIIYRGFWETNETNKLRLIDDDFEEDFVSEPILVSKYTPYGIDLYTPIIKIYKRRELNVATNLMKLIMYATRYTNIDFSKIKELYDLVDSVAEYKKEIEKYLVII